MIKLFNNIRFQTKKINFFIYQNEILLKEKKSDIN